ncbi:MAG: hypothetical protein IIZ94_02025 [Prevotella sp.]|nr:hypothetical protein [Prevotella sp.]
MKSRTVRICLQSDCLKYPVPQLNKVMKLYQLQVCDQLESCRCNILWQPNFRQDSASMSAVYIHRKWKSYKVKLLRNQNQS